MRAALAAIIAISAAISLALTPHQGSKAETETATIDQRERCVYELLVLDDMIEHVSLPLIAATLDYTDHQYGGPCTALDHLRLHGWY